MFRPKHSGPQTERLISFWSAGWIGKEHWHHVLLDAGKTQAAPHTHRSVQLFFLAPFLTEFRSLITTNSPIRRAALAGAQEKKNEKNNLNLNRTVAFRRYHSIGRVCPPARHA